MPQEKKKTGKGVGSRNGSHGPSVGSAAKDQGIAGREKSDVERQKNLDEMPELEDQEEQLENDEEVNLDLNEPPPEVMEYARRELGETDEVKCQTLQEFRDMIYGNSNWGHCARSCAVVGAERGVNVVKIGSASCSSRGR